MGGLLWWEGVGQAVGSLTGLPSVHCSWWQMGSPVPVLTPARSTGETHVVWDMGVNGSSLGTAGWVRKAGSLRGQWEEKRHSDLQAPGDAHLMPSRHCWGLSAAQSTCCHSSVCSQQWWEGGSPRQRRELGQSAGITHLNPCSQFILGRASAFP